MDVTLLGTGDTTGTPTPGCDCDTCAYAREHGVERTRFSVHIESAAGDVLLVDASPDFRAQFLRSGRPLPDTAVITHTHFDHLDGLGNVYRLVDDLPVHAADAAANSVADGVASRYDYLDAIDVDPRLPFEPFETAGLDVTLAPVEHPPLPTYGLRVADPATGGVLAISGDTTYDVGDRTREVLAGADLALVEGIVTADLCRHHPAGGDHPDDEGRPRTFGTKHMTLRGARALAEDLDAEDYRVVHTAHFVPPEAAFAADVAVDGERFSL